MTCGRAGPKDKRLIPAESGDSCAVLPLEALAYQIHLARARARGFRLADHDFLERAAHVLEEGFRAFALEYLDRVVAAGLEHLAHHVEGEFDQVHRRGLVGDGDAADVGGDVGDDQVGLAAFELGENLLEHAVFGEVALDEVDVVQRVHRQDVAGDDPAVVADDLARHLRPAAGRRAQVHDQHAGADQLVLLVQLEQLVAGPRAVAILLRAFDVRVVDVFVQPAAAAFGAFHEGARHGEASERRAALERGRAHSGGDYKPRVPLRLNPQATRP